MYILRVSLFPKLLQDIEKVYFKDPDYFLDFGRVTELKLFFEINISKVMRL